LHQRELIRSDNTVQSSFHFGVSVRKAFRRSLGHISLILAVLAGQSPAAETERVVVRPADNGEALVNPSIGWVLHYYDNSLAYYGNREEPHDTLRDFPGLSVIYLRLAWGYLEAEKGKFNWSVVDGPAQRFIDRGLQVAFRFSCYEGHSSQFEATPRWVREAGAQGDMTTEGEARDYWQPRYDDPVFLHHLEDFLAAAARRYDGNPNVAWIDVGSFGVWGEGHTKLSYAREVRKQHVNLYGRHFKKTLIAVNDDLGGGQKGKNGTLDDIVTGEGRFTLRDDSILVNPGLRAYRSAYMAERFWPHEPIILESAHYGGPRDRKFWNNGAKYAESVEAYRGSYLSIHWLPREFLNENRDFVRRMNLRMGYRLNLLEASWPTRIGLNGQFDLLTQWKNVGVAPCYPGGWVAFTLKSGKGGIVAVFVDESWNMRNLGVDMAGPNSKIVDYDDAGPKKEGKDPIRSLRLPVVGSAPVKELRSGFALSQVVKPGTYDVFLSVGDRDGTPRLALPLADSDGCRRYRLGSVNVMQ
jgi:hypothetical protein